jgi:hypothetical protein
MAAAFVAARMLLRIRETVAAGQPLADEDIRYLLASIDEWLSGTEFAAAFGVKPGPGEPDPRKTIAEIRRDELIRIAAQHFLGHVPQARRAEELHRAWTRYFDGAWRTMDRKLIDCPARHAGTLECLLFQITNLRPHVLSERQIRRILAMSPPAFAAKELCFREAGQSAQHGGSAASLEGGETMQTVLRTISSTPNDTSRIGGNRHESS